MEDLPRLLQALPHLHTLQLPDARPLVLGQLVINAADDAHSLVSAAVCNLTQTCQAPVKLQVLELTRLSALKGAGEEAARGPGPAPEVPRMQQLVDLLQPLRQCCIEGVTLCGMQDVSAATVPAVAALGRGCSRLELVECCLELSLEFWQQLLCLMPSLSHASGQNLDTLDVTIDSSSATLQQQQQGASAGLLQARGHQLSSQV
ncbi:hypothetical protein HaLaN_25815 [Haematococcus lacustris]|uniref:Uncharacterized protein n=1 Tax=Haematococcus lacustris TaxID=44745 RepID=A0A6A0A4P5_HAELA|nr:hypothetical protein HaLaN_25815 [Haematococcus lacustris]